MSLNDLQKAFLKNVLVSRDSVVDPDTGDLLDWDTLGETKRTFNVVIDGGGLVITTGVKARIQIPRAWVDIEPVDILGDHATGDVVIDIWKGTSAEGLAGTIVAGDSICGSAKPTVVNARGVSNAAQTGWTKTGNAYDWLYINVDSCADFTNLTLALTVVF